MPRSRLVILIVVCAVALSGCLASPLKLFGGYLPRPSHTYADEPSPDRPIEAGISQAEPPGFANALGDSVKDYAGQELTWSDCDGYQCATFLAPLDWTDPGAQAITIAMKMRPASVGPYQGVLMVNPGGPGGSAQDYVDAIPVSGLEGFDVIGLDSRGSGQSTPVVCGTGPQTDAYFDTDLSPDDQAERDALISAQQAFDQQCRDNSGALLDHISTIETIYDYELARKLMGADKISFYGTSYGTFLGAVYAQLYPKNVRRMVLDSAIDPRPDEEVTQAEGFDRSLRAFADWCGSVQCGLGADEQSVIDTITGFLDGLDSSPLPTKDGRLLTQSQALSGILLYMYDDADAYPELSSLLQYTMETGDGSYLLQVADAMNDRNDDGSYGSLAYSFPAISCADWGDKGVQDAFDQWTQDEQAAPIVGTYSGPSLVCPLWTAKAAPAIDFDGKGAPPILILQNTGDPATPYEDGEALAAELESATLVTRDAPGHGVYDAGSQCIDWIVVDYLVNGTVPPDGTRCTDG
ncbi:alpha/beta hydrolase [Propionimicrobium sp. PCR01-08-3]|uniref:alpha/beta hydrolase n=1 Tax=Propionimicrobium sp. PCR01-08-3 TaxID=3052086 RepID=UPI00255C2D49|nr:alpha/beta hydrolase [Propionimicrobium sp. PCR01-08-3]WIY82084.1 alpha/beta hydrolase [Propionimicrobium sp. PCR01-08-3]